MAIWGGRSKATPRLWGVWGNFSLGVDSPPCHCPLPSRRGLLVGLFCHCPLPSRRGLLVGLLGYAGTFGPSLSTGQWVLWINHEQFGASAWAGKLSVGHITDQIGVTRVLAALRLALVAPQGGPYCPACCPPTPCQPAPRAKPPRFLPNPPLPQPPGPPGLPGQWFE